MNKKPIAIVDVDELTFDFGFTAVDSEDIQPMKDEVDDLKKRLQSVEKMILPLLQNLMKNPEKEMIKWPNRKEVIETQIKRLLELTRI